MEFISRTNAGITFPVKDAVKQFFPDGRERVIRPPLVADFAEEAMTERYSHHELGDYSAPRGGGYFNTETAQRRHGWTDEEREEVEQTLLRYCPNAPNPDPYDRQTLDSWGAIELKTKPVAVPPWPTYDEVHHFKVVALAKELGLAAEALRYERLTRNRPSIVDGLAELVEEKAGEEALTAV